VAGFRNAAVLCLDDDPSRPGAVAGSVRLLAIAAHLASRGMPMSVITRPVTDWVPDVTTADVVRLAVPAGPPGDFEYLRTSLPRLIDELCRELRRRSIEVVVAHGWASAVAAHAAGQQLGVRVVTVVDDPDSGGDRARRPALARLEATVASASGAVLTASSDVADSLIRRGVPRRLLRPWAMPLLAPEAAGGLGVARAGSMVAILTTDQGGEEPSTAMAQRAVARLDGAESLVVASPPPDPREWSRFWSGPGQAIERAAVVVHVPTRGSCGHEAVVAMSRAAAVVVSSSGAHPDIVEDGITGVLVPPRSPESLVRAIRDLLDDRFLSTAMGTAAHDRVHQVHTVERVAGDLRWVIDRVATGALGQVDDTDEDAGPSDEEALSMKEELTR
jgi:D-inositol-3-phosphate glycosyltransferase